MSSCICQYCGYMNECYELYCMNCGRLLKPGGHQCNVESREVQS